MVFIFEEEKYSLPIFIYDIFFHKLKTEDMKN